MSDILISPLEGGTLLPDDRIDAAIQIIDRVLPTMVTRELVSTGEVSDLLLDMRSTLSSHTEEN